MVKVNKLKCGRINVIFIKFCSQSALQQRSNRIDLNVSTSSLNNKGEIVKTLRPCDEKFTDQFSLEVISQQCNFLFLSDRKWTANASD